VREAERDRVCSEAWKWGRIGMAISYKSWKGSRTKW